MKDKPDEELKPPSTRGWRIQREVDLELALYIRAVEAGSTPSRARLELVARGLGRYLQGREPFPRPVGRPAALKSGVATRDATAAWVLRRAGLKVGEVAVALGKADPASKETARVMRRLVKNGERRVDGERLDEGTASPLAYWLTFDAMDHLRDRGLGDLAEPRAAEARARLEDLRDAWAAARADRERRDADNENELCPAKRVRQVDPCPSPKRTRWRRSSARARISEAGISMPRSE